MINTANERSFISTIENALPRLTKEAKRDKELEPQVKAAGEAKEILEGGKGIFEAGFDPEQISDLHLMTAKPLLYVFNCSEDELADESLKDELRQLVAPAEAIFLDAKFEAELVELDDEEEAREMLADIGVEEPGLDVLARVGFETLGLQTYLTAGPKETRAWQIHKGDTAPQAAGVIHTDFQRGFIKAEIISFDDLLEFGSIADARAAGKVRLEGKDYVMQDGDVVDFKFNV